MTSPYRIKWLNNKPINVTLVSQLLAQSAAKNHFTNGGPCARLLEETTHRLLNIDPSKVVIAVNNGAAALSAVASALNVHHGKKLTWATQSYTFPSSAQGSLSGSTIVDVDAGMGPDLTQVPADVDGLIVTNVLGHVVDLDKYVQWARDNDKLLILDNAAAALSQYKGKNSLNYGQAAIISFHHTKPVGFGEGGAIIIDKEYEPAVRKIINFGYDLVKMDQQWLDEGHNYKMSDIVAVYILQYLEHLETIQRQHQLLYGHFLDKVKDIDGVSIFPNWSDGVPVTSCMPVFLDVPTPLEAFTSRGIEAKKYYKPLKMAGLALRKYDQIVCLPCNMDMTVADVDYMLACLRHIVNGSAAVTDTTA